jgi:nucleotide-binding universal stress UspA family protein
MYKKILVPVDGSPTSLLGLSEAIKIAKESAGRIRVVHVVNEFIMDPGYSGGAFNDSLVDTLRQGGQLILSNAEKLLRKQGVEFETTLLESIGGPAAELVVEQAKEWPADLIVMGTHGRRGLRRLALGSDAEGVLRTATVPVLLIRNTAKE